MFIFNNRYIRWLLLALCAVAVLWLWQQQFKKAMPAQAVESPGVDYSLSDIRLRQHADDGSARFIIAANSIEHLPVKSVYELNALKLDWLPETSSHWKVDAKSGVMNEARDDLQLQNGIIAIHEADNGDVQVNTDSLRVLPNQQQAETESPVTIVFALGEAAADGALIDIERSTVELRRNVKARYYPDGRPSQ